MGAHPLEVARHRLEGLGIVPGQRPAMGRPGGRQLSLDLGGDVVEPRHVLLRSVDPGQRMEDRGRLDQIADRLPQRRGLTQQLLRLGEPSRRQCRQRPGVDQLRRHPQRRVHREGLDRVEDLGRFLRPAGEGQRRGQRHEGVAFEGRATQLPEQAGRLPGLADGDVDVTPVGDGLGRVPGEEGSALRRALGEAVGVLPAGEVEGIVEPPGLGQAFAADELRKPRVPVERTADRAVRLLALLRGAEGGLDPAETGEAEAGHQ